MTSMPALRPLSRTRASTMQRKFRRVQADSGGFGEVGLVHYVSLVIAIAVFAVIIVAYVQIITKAGYSPWWILLPLAMPVMCIVTFAVLANDSFGQAFGSSSVTTLTNDFQFPRHDRPLGGDRQLRHVPGVRLLGVAGDARGPLPTAPDGRDDLRATAGRRSRWPGNSRPERARRSRPSRLQWPPAWPEPRRRRKHLRPPRQPNGAKKRQQAGIGLESSAQVSRATGMARPGRLDESGTVVRGRPCPSMMHPWGDGPPSQAGAERAPRGVSRRPVGATGAAALSPCRPGCTRCTRGSASVHRPPRPRTRCTLGFQRRLVRRCEWLTFMPNEGFFPQISHTDAMGEPS